MLNTWDGEDHGHFTLETIQSLTKKKYQPGVVGFELFRV